MTLPRYGTYVRKSRLLPQISSIQRFGFISWKIWLLERQPYSTDLVGWNLGGGRELLEWSARAGVSIWLFSFTCCYIPDNHQAKRAGRWGQEELACSG